jgi:putative transcriptional regulator
MKTNNQAYKSEMLGAIHCMAAGAHRAGAMEKTTMREFDARCLTPLIENPVEDIRALRDAEQISQRVLAYHLNVTPGLISQWERGEKRPSGPALKLLSLIKHKGLEAIA